MTHKKRVIAMVHLLCMVMLLLGPAWSLAKDVPLPEVELELSCSNDWDPVSEDLGVLVLPLHCAHSPSVTEYLARPQSRIRVPLAPLVSSEELPRPPPFPSLTRSAAHL